MNSHDDQPSQNVTPDLLSADLRRDQLDDLARLQRKIMIGLKRASDVQLAWAWRRRQHHLGEC